MTIRQGKKREKLASMPDEDLRRKYEKKARKMAAMVAYGQKHADYKTKAKTASKIIFEYLSYIAETRALLERPVDIEEYIKRRNEGKIGEPSEYFAAQAAEDLKWRCTALISEIAAACEDKPDK